LLLSRNETLVVFECTLSNSTSKGMSSKVLWIRTSK
jgi:hypothetical protein